MCIYYYLHYHHIPPCVRDIEWAIHYDFCPNSTYLTVHIDPTGHESAEPQGLLAIAFGMAHIPSADTLYQYSSTPARPSSTPVAAAAVFSNNAQYNNNNNNNTTQTYSSSSRSGGEAIFDYSDPCTMGGCLVSQGCGSGQCRLEQLGGRWTCCRCRRGGNTFRSCAHTMVRVPDTLCYHAVCLGCWAEPGPSGQGHRPGRGGGSA
ncbi:hypothetical protein PG995_009084 [Apiospora arundinis]